MRWSPQVRTWISAGVGAGEIVVSTRIDRTCAKAAEHLKTSGIPAALLRADASDSATAVRIGAMHSFKGLEFRCVAVLGVNDGALPMPRAVTPVDVDRLQHETDMMSERCLLFVACIRVRDSPHVSWSGQPSSFLSEADVARS